MKKKPTWFTLAMAQVHLLQRPGIYIAEFHSGVVKVGCSRNTRTRIASLAYQGHRLGFGRIERLHIEYFAAAKKIFLPWQVERDVRDRLKSIGNPVGKHKEFFSDVQFGCAVTLAQQKAKAFDAQLKGHSAPLPPAAVPVRAAPSSGFALGPRALGSFIPHRRGLVAVACRPAALPQTLPWLGCEQPSAAPAVLPTGAGAASSVRFVG